MLSTSRMTFIDVELANASRASICEIGIIRIEDGCEVFRKKFLINPEVPFDRANVKIHGITSERVTNCPHFPEVWRQIEVFLTSGIIVAHNAASVELNALSASLARYGLPLTDFYYICTLQLARAWIDSPNGYGLEALCDLLGILLVDHHDALADAQACMELFNHINTVNAATDSDVATYRYSGCPEKVASADSRVDKALNELAGLIYGVGGDNIISQEELGTLEKWLADYAELNSDIHIAECMEVLSGALEDRYITAIEYAKLLNIAKPVEKSRAFGEATLAMQVLFGILDGIACDNVINDHELNTLLQWLKSHTHLSGVYPFDNILDIVTDIIEDGVITKAESDELIAAIKRFTSPLETNPCRCGEGGVCISGKSFCLSGNFQHGEKSDIGKAIEAAGGVIVSGVSRKTDYLAVGGMGSGEWKFGNYGSKVSKALELQEQGMPITILSEIELFKALDDCT